MTYSKTTKKTDPVQKEIDKVIKIISAVDDDPHIKERAEESHKRLGYISTEDMQKLIRTY